MNPRSFGGPLLATFLTAVLVCITILGGCPVAQTPGQPSTEPNQTTTVSGPTGPSLPGGDRPVTLPVPDQQQTGGTTGPTGATGGTTLTSPANSAFLRVSEPFDSRVLRPGASVTVEFFISLGPGTTLSGTELVVARDDNRDGVADGNPVLSRTVTAAAGSNSVTFNTQETVDQGLLTHGLGRFVLGVRVATGDGTQVLRYASGTISVDSQSPTATWVYPTTDNLLSRDPNWAVTIRTQDNSPITLTILLDPDLVPLNGNEVQFAKMDLQPDPNSDTLTTTVNLPLSTFPVGRYYYYYTVTDGFPPVASGYAPNPTTGGYARLGLTDRLIGPFDLNQLDPQADPNGNTGVLSKGAILQGFNFNDLAGSAMTGVPDINGDGYDDLVIVSRFGKPRLESVQGIGYGEAYLILGQPGRLRTPKRLNAVGSLTPSGIQGLVFTGIRCPRTTSWTEGISDVTYVPDMDGDGLPDLVFSFPRTESITLTNNPWQPPVSAPYTPMGSLEYDPDRDGADTVDLPDPNNPGSFLQQRSDFEVTVDGSTWLKNRTQFTRGGIVICSSSNAMFKSTTQLGTRGDRVIDLHEVGQMFTNMRRAEQVPRLVSETASPDSCFACDPNATDSCGDPNDGKDTAYQNLTLAWETLLNDQGPVGFDNWLTDRTFWDPQNPPLANISVSSVSLSTIRTSYVHDANDPCGTSHCVVNNTWDTAVPCLFSGVPGTRRGAMYWEPNVPTTSVPGFYVYTGFYGFDSVNVSPWDTTIGARVLGQAVNDKFGTAVASDGTWLYMIAPQHSARQEDVPRLGLPTGGRRALSGSVYQYRIATPGYVGGPTQSQLWIEPGTHLVGDPNDPNSFVSTPIAFPYLDAQIPGNQDSALPVPHTYVIKDSGYGRANDVLWPEEWVALGNSDTTYPGAVRQLPYSITTTGCDTALTTAVLAGVRPSAKCTSPVWTAPALRYHNLINRTRQIVGPHAGARISSVRSVGDVDGDGIADFAVGSPDIRDDFDPNGAVLGGIFIVYGRPTGLEGDYLLEELAYDTSNINRLAGVFLKGNPPASQLARVFDSAGDFNGDGFGDVIIGNEVAASNAGEVIVLLGSPTLQSPGGGWTIDTAVAANVAVRFTGEAAGDLAGANVSRAGDVDGDGYSDILIAAPGAMGGKGAVYLIYGSAQYGNPSFPKTFSLSKVGTFVVPGAKFIGRAVGDALGGGTLTYGDGNPANVNGSVFLNPDHTPVTVYSKGVTMIGDVDGDGHGDIAISSMLADALGRRDSGEVYIIYGRGDPH